MIVRLRGEWVIRMVTLRWKLITLLITYIVFGFKLRDTILVVRLRELMTYIFPLLHLFPEVPRIPGYGALKVLILLEARIIRYCGIGKFVLVRCACTVVPLRVNRRVVDLGHIVILLVLRVLMTVSGMRLRLNAIMLIRLVSVWTVLVLPVVLIDTVGTIREVSLRLELVSMRSRIFSVTVGRRSTWVSRLFLTTLIPGAFLGRLGIG